MSRSIPIRLDDEVIEAIESHPGYRQAIKGRAGGGVAGFIRDLLLRQLGLEPAMDPHEEQSRRWAEERAKRERAAAEKTKVPRWFKIVSLGATSCPRGPFPSEEQAREAWRRWARANDAEAGNQSCLRLYGYRTRAEARDGDVSDEGNVLFRAPLS